MVLVRIVMQSASRSHRAGMVTFLGMHLLGTNPLKAQPCRWEGLVGGPIGTSVRVRSMAIFDDGNGSSLFVAGSFPRSLGAVADNIVKWDGASWESLGHGVSSAVFALAVFDDGAGPALYAGGWFLRAGSLSETNRIARWDGREWSALGSGMFSMGQFGRDDSVKALTVFDDGTGAALYAGGHFDEAGGIPAKSIARWDGRSWSTVGTGLVRNNGDAGEVRALAVYDDGFGPALYAAGVVRPPGASSSGLVRWNGQGWVVVGGGVGPLPDTLGVFDDGTGPGLYIGGQLSLVGNLLVNGIARWDGRDWSALGVGTSHEVRSLAVFDDGAGPALYAGGSFFDAGGVRAMGIARWNGVLWSALGDGLWSYPIGPSVNAVGVFDEGSGPALYVGGSFEGAGGIPANGIARWRCPSCSADCDQSTGRGVLDIFDFLCFQNRYGKGDPYACDCDTGTGTGVCDIFDFLCFQNAYHAGCP